MVVPRLTELDQASRNARLKTITIITSLSTDASFGTVSARYYRDKNNKHWSEMLYVRPGPSL